MRFVFLFLILIPQFSFALRAGPKSCYGSSPLAPLELMNAENYAYSQTCAIPILINDLLVKRNLPQLLSCYEHALASHHSVEEVSLPIIVAVYESRIDAVAVGSDSQQGALATELRSCVRDAISKIPAPSPQIREIGGAQPWILKGIVRFGIGQ